MSMRWLESFASEAYDLRKRFDNVPTSLLESKHVESGNDKNFVTPDADCLEVGTNLIGTQAKQVPATDVLVVGFQYTWEEHIVGTSLTASVDIDIEDINMTNIGVLTISGAGGFVFTVGGTGFAAGSFDNGSTGDSGSGYVEMVIQRHPTLGQCDIFIDGVLQGTANNIPMGNKQIEFVRWGTTFQGPLHQQFSHIFLEDVTGEGTYTAKAVWYINRTFAQGLVGSNNWDNPTNAAFSNEGSASAGVVGADIEIDAAGTAAGAVNIYAVQLSYSLAKDGTEPVGYSLNMTMNGVTLTTDPRNIGSLSVRDYYHSMKVDPVDQTPLSEADIATITGGVIITNRGI